MPEFVHPFAGLAADRKVTNEELVRAIRFAIAAEYEAIQVYMQLAESTDNRLAQEVLKEIADEEVVHAGELLRLLYELEPREAALYAEGAAEVEEIAARLAGGNPGPGQSAEPGNSPAEPIAAELEVAAAEAEEPPCQAIEQEVTEVEPEQKAYPLARGIGNLFEKP